MDVGVWLRGLGLGQYEEKFRDNKIDADVLPRLTADDLKDVGVAAVGDRRRLLDAIAALAAAKPADAPPFAHKSVPPKSDQLVAERRPITVMFCDLVGSTSLAARLDAEDWRNLVNAYLDEASAAVTSLGGHVLKKLGDCLMVLFGYPQAQENDAERAVRAALAIQRALADLNARNARSGAPELSARIGIECGSVVVDASGEVFGEAPNVAARVQRTSISIPFAREEARQLLRGTGGARRPEQRGRGRPGDAVLRRAAHRVYRLLSMACARRRRRPANVGAASGMHGQQYKPDERGVYLIHPDDVRPFERGGFVLLENQEVA